MASTYQPYKTPGFRAFGLGPVSLALLMVGALILMLPFTQYLAGFQKDDSTVRKFEITPPPPNFTPPEPPPPPPQEQTEPPPQMDSPPPQLSLSQLTMDIAPGIGTAMVGGLSASDFGITAEDTLAQAKLFEVGELDARPSLRNASIVMRNFDRILRRELPNLERRRVNLDRAVAMIRINEDGSVDFIEFTEISEPLYREGLVVAIEEAFSFTTPTVNGEPVAARYYIPLEWTW